jgi:hypothetical protein
MMQGEGVRIRLRVSAEDMCMHNWLTNYRRVVHDTRRDGHHVANAELRNSKTRRHDID